MFSSDSAWPFNLFLRNHSDDNDSVWRRRPEHRQRCSALQHRQTVSRQTFTEHVLHWCRKRRHCHSYSSHVTWQRGGLTWQICFCVCGVALCTRLKRFTGVYEMKHPFIPNMSPVLPADSRNRVESASVYVCRVSRFGVCVCLSVREHRCVPASRRSS